MSYYMAEAGSRPITGFSVCKYVLDKIWKEYEANIENSKVEHNKNQSVLAEISKRKNSTENEEDIMSNSKQKRTNTNDEDTEIKATNTAIAEGENFNSSNGPETSSTGMDSHTEISETNPVCELKQLFINEIDTICQRLSNNYHTDNVNNDYSELLVQAAYVKSTITMHADMLVLCLFVLDIHLECFEGKREFELVSIGSGPGTDMLALIIFYFQKECHSSPSMGKTTIQSYLYDSNRNWEKILRYVEEAFEIQRSSERLKTIDVFQIKPSTFINLNLVKDTFNSDNPGYRTADLFTFSYIFSELIKLEEVEIIENYMLELFKTSKNGAFFLFTDQRSVNISPEKELIKAIVAKSGCMTRVDEDFTYPAEYQNTLYKLSSAEQKTELDEYISSGSWSPRLSTSRFCLIYKKVETVTIANDTEETRPATNEP